MCVYRIFDEEVEYIMLNLIIDAYVYDRKITDKEVLKELIKMYNFKGAL